jgi:hypothetical protein
VIGGQSDRVKVTGDKVYYRVTVAERQTSGVSSGLLGSGSVAACRLTFESQLFTSKFGEKLFFINLVCAAYGDEYVRIEHIFGLHYSRYILISLNAMTSQRIQC